MKKVKHFVTVTKNMAVKNLNVKNCILLKYFARENKILFENSVKNCILRNSYKNDMTKKFGSCYAEIRWGVLILIYRKYKNLEILHIN